MTVFAGLDVHKKYFHGTAMNKSGDILVQGEFPNETKGYDSLLDRTGEEVKVAFEATYAWEYVYEELEDRVEEVKLAHPKRTEVITKERIKTDAIDARTLAHLLRADLIPESYVPRREIRELRDKVRLRTKLVREKARLKNKIHAELEKNRIVIKGNTFSKKNRKLLRDSEIRAVNHYLAVIETLEERIGIVSGELEEIAEGSEEAKLLMTIPGVGYFSALTILAEIGDVERFPDPEKLCSYAGLVPRVRQSGDTLRLGRIKKGGDKMLRWILVESVWSHIRHSNSKLTDYYHRKRREKGPKRAAIATARKMLTTIYFMLKREEEFRNEG